MTRTNIARTSPYEPTIGFSRAVQSELEQDRTDHFVQRDRGDGQCAKALTERREGLHNHHRQAQCEAGRGKPHN